MKQIGLASLLALLTFSALSFAANPESISLICTGHQPMVGGEKTGAVVIKASTPGLYTYGNPWKIDVSWQGEKDPIMGAGLACGEVVPSALNCYVKRSGPNLAFQLTQSCGPIKFNTGYPRSPYLSAIVLDQDHGYFNCDSNIAGMHIRLSDCQSQP
ncbi:MAG: hypothetical protein ACXVA9_00485 [Bdellovibrionales bacterium]